MTRIPIDCIRVSENRRPLRDVKALADSMEEIGLLNPITVRRDGPGYVLVAGLHRLEAAKRLDWLEIEAVVVNLTDLEAELAEIDENLIRHDLTVLEQSQHLLRRESVLEAMGVRAPVGGQVGNRNAAKNGGETVSPPFKTTADVAHEMGLSERAAQQRKQIARSIPDDVRDAIRNTDVADSTRELLTLARQDEETQREVAGRIVAGAANVSQALTDIRKEARVERMAEPAPDFTGADALYPVVYADPPWRYEFSEVTAWGVEEHYPTMTVEEICALDVPATDNAVLFLWATAPKLPEALKVMAAWGFAYKTSAVWDKQVPRIGYWFRGQHELLLVGTKGDVPPPDVPARPSSVFTAPRGRHSEKPAAVREAIEAMFPNLPRIELFARERVEGWDCWGNEAP